MLAVETKGLSKSFVIYKSLLNRVMNKGIKIEALKSVNLEIKKGEIFGLLGPNGAGKTTLLNILSTLVLPDSGSAKIFGFDVVTQAEKVRKNISLSSAYSGFHGEITVKETLELFKMIYGLTTNVKRFIPLLDLEECQDKMFEELSSGNRQKVSIAKTLMINPKLMLLDELTVALDPNIALKLRNILKNWNKRFDTTILLATHNMYEADDLCNRVAIIHKGKIIACDTPQNLKKLIRGEESINILVNEQRNPSKFLQKLDGIKRMSFSNNRITVHVDEAEKRLQRIIQTLVAKNYHVMSLKVREPTLEDVFIKLTGTRLE